MRVPISTNIEGVAGIYHRVQTTPGKPEYERAAADDRSRGRRERCQAAGLGRY
ncbi:MULTISPECIES: M55 family metallopeptidase [Methylobacterium]|uniref:M55 family metallopeptidase n=1 Tax=Methylobacterium TaxID=407 RepID=UPI00039A2575|nr:MULTISPECIES: M55 family metallopeptidase [Methylobacterium]UIN32637.1 M55 family metallopeptidase [Methylobacterium oryzae]